MAVDFRCEKCGKLLSVDGAPDSKVKCPYCKAKVTVPAGLASMPRPQISPAGPAPPAAPPVRQPQQPPAEGEEQYVHEPDVLMGVMAAVMPWVISVFFHAGLLVILFFITIVMISTVTAEGEATIPDAEFSEDPGGRVNPGEADPDMEARSMNEVAKDKWAMRDSTIATASMGETESKVSVIGIAGGSAGGSMAAFGLTTGGSGAGPRSRFFGTGGNAYHICYVVDRSGSMLDTLDLVKREMLRSISRLGEAQSFHVIFFATGEPKENPPRRLVYATEDYKRDAAKYLRDIRAQGRTDPIPAIRRAFAVLRRTPNTKKGKLIYLLTDGEFPDNEKVLKAVKEMNKRGNVYINTILHHHRSSAAIDVLKRIADGNGGRFKFIGQDE